MGRGRKRIAVKFETEQAAMDRDFVLIIAQGGAGGSSGKSGDSAALSPFEPRAALEYDEENKSYVRSRRTTGEPCLESSCSRLVMLRRCN